MNAPINPVVKPEARKGQMTREDYAAIMASLESILNTLREIRDKHPPKPPPRPLGPAIW